MQYRRLGRTGLEVSVLGVGGGYVMLLELEPGSQLYQRAFDLGVNYFDGRYGDSSRKLRPVLKRDRERCVVAIKTRETTAEGVIHRVEEDLGELDTDYIDVYLLRCYTHEMLQEYLIPDGAFDGLIRAREQGKIRFMGLANHGDPGVLVAGIETGLVDVVLFPLNIVQREALDRLIPVAQEHDVGLAVMKPLSVGKIPADVGLRWLANQPIHTTVPGMSSLEHLEVDVAAVEREPLALAPEEEAEVERCRGELDRRACRICQDACQSVCEKGLPVDVMIHHDVLYEHYRNLGLEAFLEFPLTPWAKRAIEGHFSRRLAKVQECTWCGLCEERCPHNVRILDMLEQMLVDHPPLIQAARERGWTETYEDAEPPWGGGSRQRRRHT
jgi:predicted aldo/keto reductase-like oxidoreductase